jgi:hypothetical protein
MGRPQTQYDPVLKVEDLIEKFETCSSQSTRAPGHPPGTSSPAIQSDRETALSSTVPKKSKADILQVETASTLGLPAPIVARPNSFQDEKAATQGLQVLMTANTNNMLLESQPDIKVMTSSTQVSEPSNTINTSILDRAHRSATRERADRITARQYKSQAKAMVLRPAGNLAEYIAKFEDLCRRGHYAAQEWEETLRDGLTDDLKRYLANRDTDGDFEAAKHFLSREPLSSRSVSGKSKRRG